MNNKEIFIEAANRIGERIAKKAIWNNNSCTWEIMTVDRTRPTEKISITQLANGIVYQGTAGIALFLNELYKMTGKIKFLTTAEGALNFSLEDINKLPENSFGFYSGKIGIAYAAAKYGRCTGKESYIKYAKNITNSLKGIEEFDIGLDVIGGAAGAIPVLLTEILKDESNLQIAINLGEHLIKVAFKEPIGWSWYGGNTNYRNLCGLGHGASGFGNAFIELYNATGSSRYLYAAEQAFLYERQFLNAEVYNWPDFRNIELFNYIQNGQYELLKEIVKKGKSPKYYVKYMDAWCHGAPGIGLARLRAYEITKNLSYKHEAEIAIEGIKNYITKCNQKSIVENFSLCHGIFGNCENLIYGANILGNLNLLDLAEEIAVLGWETFEVQNKPWLCGTLGSVSDPSLMLGEAGIGYHFLRLFNSKISSLLLPNWSINTCNFPTMDDSYKPVQQDYINIHFGKTIEALKKANIQTNNLITTKNLKIGGKTSDVNFTFKKLNKMLHDKTRESNNAINENFFIESLKYKHTLKINDFTEEFLNELKKEKLEVESLNRTLLKLSPHVTLVVKKYNVPISKIVNNNRAAKNNSREKYILLYKRNNRFYQMQLDVFPYSILKLIKSPLTINEINKKAARLFGIKRDSDDYLLLKDKIRRQITVAFEANFLERFKESPPTRIINKTH